MRKRARYPGKRWILLLMACLGLLMGPAGVWAQASDPDLNNDGVVNILDVSMVGSCFGQDPAANLQCQVADTDGDGDVDFDDLTYVTASFGQTGFPTESDPPIQLSITSPIAGSLINQSTVLVRGTVTSQNGEVGVLVNGVVAHVNGDEFVANRVPLQEGMNTVTATATDFDGNTLSESVEVSVIDLPNPVQLSANPGSGTAPLDVEFSIRTTLNTPITSFTLDADGDGIVEVTSSTVPESFPYTYTQPGLYLATATLTDDQGNDYADTLAINVLSLPELDDLIQGRLQAMRAALLSGNLDEALTHFTDHVREQYRAIFTRQLADLPRILSSIDQFHLLDATGNLANAEAVRTQNGVAYSFPIILIKDRDGLWKIQSF